MRRTGPFGEGAGTTVSGAGAGTTVSGAGAGATSGVGATVGVLGRIRGSTLGGSKPIMSSKPVLYGSPSRPEFVNSSKMSMFAGDGDTDRTGDGAT